MPGEEAEDDVVQWPLAPVIVQYELVVLHVLRKVLELHQRHLLLNTLHLLLLRRLRLRLRLLSLPVVAHLSSRFAGKLLSPANLPADLDRPIS